MTPLRQRMLEDLQIRGRAVNTQRSYIEKIKHFAEHFGESPERLGPEEIRAYQVYLVNFKRDSRSQLAQFVAAARFLYGVTLQRKWAIASLPYPKSPRRLPIVLSEQEVKQLLEAVINIKHRAIVMTLYSAGLRVAEACGLRVTDIDSGRMVIRVDQGKGAKDRYVQLSETLLHQLREYWKKFRPQHCLFLGRRGRPITTRHVYRVCVDAGLTAGIRKTTNPHCLRHSIATHMLERGTSILEIQAFLGHSSLSSTARYLHLMGGKGRTSINPLDAIMGEGREEQDV
jgi:integrase/recombinase XerD